MLSSIELGSCLIREHPALLPLKWTRVYHFAKYFWKPFEFFLCNKIAADAEKLNIQSAYIEWSFTWYAFVHSDNFFIVTLGLNQTVQDDPEAFESRKALKEVYEAGIYLFNRGKVSRGLALLQENNLLGTSAEEIAMFLHNESRLCRTAIGDFLGENEAFALEVMYAYVDCFDFSGLELLPALRSVLHFACNFHFPWFYESTYF